MISQTDYVGIFKNTAPIEVVLKTPKLGFYQG